MHGALQDAAAGGGCELLRPMGSQWPRTHYCEKLQSIVVPCRTYQSALRGFQWKCNKFSQWRQQKHKGDISCGSMIDQHASTVAKHLQNVCLSVKMPKWISCPWTCHSALCLPQVPGADSKRTRRNVMWCTLMHFPSQGTSNLCWEMRGPIKHSLIIEWWSSRLELLPTVAREMRDLLTYRATPLSMTGLHRRSPAQAVSSKGVHRSW